MTRFRSETSELLYKIEAVAGSLSTRGRWLAADVQRLKARPDYPTLAGRELQLAETELSNALSVVKQAKADLQRKPVEQLQAAE